MQLSCKYYEKFAKHLSIWFSNSTVISTSVDERAGLKIKDHVFLQCLNPEKDKPALPKTGPKLTAKTMQFM